MSTTSGVDAEDDAYNAAHAAWKAANAVLAQRLAPEAARTAMAAEAAAWEALLAVSPGHRRVAAQVREVRAWL